MKVESIYSHSCLVLATFIICTVKLAESKFCEGGHICSLPRECCIQGCCPPYQSGVRPLPATSEHVLNLFLISHWFFWCFVAAILLAILCAYSLWKKRRTLCGWGLSENRTQSEGDSAGSCYAPPQYSRCSSFHHPPPPYTEVTSKPDLYPLVFTCNSENGKCGSSFLMVQYFRNYIVRPNGSLSAASTVDSLSSSFIYNANEANTLIPPPYSQATSPDNSRFHSPHQHQHEQQQAQQQQQLQQQQHQCIMPRSASEAICLTNTDDSAQHQHQTYVNRYTQGHFLLHRQPHHQQQQQEISSTFNEKSCEQDINAIADVCGAAATDENDCLSPHNSHREQRFGEFTQSRSDNQFLYLANSNRRASDIFRNISNAEGSKSDDHINNKNNAGSFNSSRQQQLNVGQPSASLASSNGATAQTHASSLDKAKATKNMNSVYNVCRSMRGSGASKTSISTLAEATDTDDLNRLRKSLQSCCQMLQKHETNLPTHNNPMAHGAVSHMKKYTDDDFRSYTTSTTCSGVSSLANIYTPSSPPQATSPTGDVKEILDQIRKLQHFDEDLQRLSVEPIAPGVSRQTIVHAHTNLKVMPNAVTLSEVQNRLNTDLEAHSSITQCHTDSVHSAASSCRSVGNRELGPEYNNHVRRPSSLLQSKRKRYSHKGDTAIYIPIMSNLSASTNHYILKSPVSATILNNCGRFRKYLLTQSAPATPASNLPAEEIDDHSPLLNNAEQEDEQKPDGMV